MIDPLFFSQECSDARICLRTGPVCMCGIEKMQERMRKLEDLLQTLTERAIRENEDGFRVVQALAALDADAKEGGG